MNDGNEMQAPARETAVNSKDRPRGGLVRQGEVGMMLAEGDVVLTVTGRRTSPFPWLDFSTDRKTSNSLARVDQWLMGNAASEAWSRGDEHNARAFERATNSAPGGTGAGLGGRTPTSADKDIAEMYLFDLRSVYSLPQSLFERAAYPRTEDTQ